MRFTKKIINDELYLYYNGKLIYKRWISKNRSVIFDVSTYDKNTLVSITDKGVKFMLLIILLAMTSCGTETVFYWNMRDVIGLSIFGFAVAVYFVLIIVEWFTNKLKLWKRKETK